MTDVLILAPHPDDAELHVGGTILALRQAGRSVTVLDLTAGELSSRGTPELRAQERSTASRILTLTAREQLHLPDGALSPEREEQVRALVSALRRLRPRTVLYPHLIDRHPDHEAAGRLCEKALFLANIRKYDSESSHAAHRTERAFRYVMHQEIRPDFVVDISPWISQKLDAIRAYGSQFEAGPDSGPDTYISTPAFLEALMGRWKRWGFLIGAEYAEGFVSKELVAMPLSGISPDPR